MPIVEIRYWGQINAYLGWENDFYVTEMYIFKTS